MIMSHDCCVTQETKFTKGWVSDIAAEMLVSLREKHTNHGRCGFRMHAIGFEISLTAV